MIIELLYCKENFLDTLSMIVLYNYNVLSNYEGQSIDLASLLYKLGDY